jgi:hypothetical protein
MKKRNKRAMFLEQELYLDRALMEIKWMTMKNSISKLITIWMHQERKLKKIKKNS